MTLEQWLSRDDTPEADWAPHVLRLANTGALGRSGKLLLDLPALAQPWACTANACAPGRRDAKHRSCCADLDVAVGPEERTAIAASIDAIAIEMGDDPRWSTGIPAWFEGDTFRRPGRRCVFARLEAGGLICGLHRTEDTAGLPRGTLKPVPCRLFPLAVVDLGERHLLTAVHRTTARMLGSYPAARFPCLGAGLTTLARAEVSTLESVFGLQQARRIAAAAEAWSDAR